MNLAIERYHPLRLGFCPRCGSPLSLTASRVQEDTAMVACQKEWIRKGGKRVAFCGFLWFAPWSAPVLRT